MADQGKQSFLKGAAILSIAGILFKILGAVFKIPLYQIIKGDGMGYYSTAYPIYVLLLSFSTAGIPIAISKMISQRFAEEKFEEARVVLKKAIWILLFLGFIMGSSIFAFAPKIMSLAGNPGAALSLAALAPALLITPIMSAYRGYFQGQQKMIPTAFSQIAEQSTRVILGLVLAYIFVAQGAPYGAQGAAAGTSFGCFVGLFVIMFFYWKDGGFISGDRSALNTITYMDVVRELIQIALPIILGSLVLPLMNAADVTIVIGRLINAGYSQMEANRMMGHLQGMANTLISFPQILITAVASSIVPVISAQYAGRDMNSAKAQSLLAMKLVFLIALPASAGLFILSSPIMRLLFSGEPASLGKVLAVVSLQLVFLGVIQITTAVLQGIGKVLIPVKNLVIALGVKVILTYILTGIHDIHILGAAFATVVSYALLSILNYKAFCNALELHGMAKRLLIKPLLATVEMAFGTLLFYCLIAYYLTGSWFGFSIIALLTSILAGMILYVCCLIWNGGITVEEASRIPGVAKIVKAMDAKKK